MLTILAMQVVSIYLQ